MSSRPRLASRRAPLLLLATHLVACSAHVDLDPAPPSQVEVPATWSASDRTAGERAPTAPVEGLEQGWWRLLGDATVDALVREALEQNFDLAAAAARLDAALAQARIQGADLLPQLGLDVSGNRAKRNFIGFPIPGARDQVLSVTSTTYSLGLNASWEADLWGRLRSRRAAGALEAAASEEDLDAARLSLSAQVVKAYLGLLESQLQVELAERTLESRRLTGRQVRERYERGLTPSFDLRLALAQIASVESSLAQRRRVSDLAARQIEVLLGRYPGGALQGLAPSAELPRAPEAIPPGLPGELLLRRPDLRAAYDRALAAAASLAASRAALYPRLTLTGSGGTSSIELADLVDGDFSIWSFAAGLLQPLFQGGRLRAGVELASAAEEQALAAYVQTTLDAFAEVESSLASERYLAAQVRALEEATAQSAAAQRLARDRYGAGLADYLSVLESEREAFLSESSLLAARQARVAAWVDVVLALGGDFSPTPTPPPPNAAGE